MNTFLRSVNGRALRKYFSHHKYAISIIDFRGFQIFESKNTYTCLFYMGKTDGMANILYTVDEQGELSDNPEYDTIPYEVLDDAKGWTLNGLHITTAIELTGIQIKDYCPSRHGIATLSNDTYIFKPVDEDAAYYYLEIDGKKIPIEKGICKDAINPNRLKSIDQVEEFIEKLIFPYYIENGRASVINPDKMRRDFPRTYDYLNTQKDILLSRDKGNTALYSQWYAYGRTQSLTLPRYKLFFPKFANRPINCFFSDNPNLMLYNGMAFVNSEARKLKILKAILESKWFWQYIQRNGKPYASGYFSLSGVDIKYFGIPVFSIEEENELLSMNDKSEIEIWLRGYYNIEKKI